MIQLKVHWACVSVQSSYAINRSQVNLPALWVTDCYNQSLEITRNKNTFAKTVSAPVLSDKLTLN